VGVISVASMYFVCSGFFCDQLNELLVIH
jgi:hypothetical protein